MRCLPALAGCLLLAALPCAAAPAQEPARIAAESYTLPNGLKVILAADHATQVVAVNVWYNVGSRNERPGRTGFAHLFEHMMFQGSAQREEGRAHGAARARRVGSINGSTSEDRTNYYEPLPSNRLNLGLWLEADRMRSLAITDDEVPQPARGGEGGAPAPRGQPAVHAARSSRRRTTRSTRRPASPTRTRSSARWPISTRRRPRTSRQFFDTYYAPNNATLVVAGDFEPADAKRARRAVFRRHPARRAPAAGRSATSSSTPAPVRRAGGGHEGQAAGGDAVSTACRRTTAPTIPRSSS